MKLNVAYRSVPRAGEEYNGDSAFVCEQGEHWLLAVIDGLGHGMRAAMASDLAVEQLRALGTETPVGEIIEQLDKSLNGTRGAAAMICRFDGKRLEGCGVGNVELRAPSTRVPVVLTPGILGAGVRSCKVFGGDLQPHDRLILFSDGLSGRLSDAATRMTAPEQACDLLLERYRRSHDDATVMIVDVEEKK